jgi:uncharacterized membrane protein
MGVNRIEAFSDGVIAVIITIMVLEFKLPPDASLESLLKLMPVFLSYVLSFVTVGIMWINHHHLLKIARRADAPLMWANNNLLFWMSLVPFVTAYMAANPGKALPVALYGLALTPMSLGFVLLRVAIAKQQGEVEELVAIHRKMQWKNIFSGLMYLAGACLAFAHVEVSYLLYILVPATYFLPERRLEQFMAGSAD